jgi:hypothetical protein
MAASAGEGASKDPADYLATATSLMGSYSIIGAATAADPQGVAIMADTVTAQPHAAATDGGRKLLQTNVVQDLLVVYTPAAASSAGGDASIQNAIRIAVEQTNQAYVNSRVALTVRLVGIRPVSCRGHSGRKGRAEDGAAGTGSLTVAGV